MTRRTTVVRCPSCNHANEFDQPYAYHAGFGNQGFLYNDAGTLTLVWSSFDAAYETIVGQRHPWTLGPKLRAILEASLVPAPTGGSWRFANPPRCVSCGAPIGKPMCESNIYYLVYPGSVILDEGPSQRAFAKVLRPESAATV